MTSPAPTCRPIATPDRREIACVPYPLSAGDRTLPKTVSFRRSLLTNLLAMVLLLAVAIFLMTALSSRRVVWSLSESLIEQASRRTELKLRGFFQPVERQTRGLRSLGESGMLDIDDPDQLRPLFQSLLGEYPSNSAVFVADDRGREFLLRDEGDHWRSRQLRPDEWGEQARWREWRKVAGEPVETVEQVEYDPRERPWFKGALSALDQEESGSELPVYWTEPYIFFSTQRPGQRHWRSCRKRR